MKSSEIGNRMESSRYQLVSHERDFMLPTEVSENEKVLQSMGEIKRSLEKFERSKILEVYFSRVDGRIPGSIPDEYQELYAIELGSIKSYLLGQHPQDSLLQRIFRMMN